MSSPAPAVINFIPRTMTVVLATEGRDAVSYLRTIKKEESRCALYGGVVESIFQRVIENPRAVGPREIVRIKSVVFEQYRLLMTDVGESYMRALDAVAMEAYACDPARIVERAKPLDKMLLSCGHELAGTAEGVLYLMVGRSMGIGAKIKLKPENVTMMKIFAGKFGGRYRPTDKMLRAIQILRGIFPRAHAYAQNLERETSFSGYVTESGFLDLDALDADALR